MNNTNTRPAPKTLQIQRITVRTQVRAGVSRATFLCLPTA